MQTRLFWNLTRLCPRCNWSWNLRAKEGEEPCSCPGCKARLHRWREVPDGQWERIGLLSMEVVSDEWIREQRAIDRAEHARKRAIYQSIADLWKIERMWKISRFTSQTIAKEMGMPEKDLQNILVSHGWATWKKPPVPTQTA